MAKKKKVQSEKARSPRRWPLAIVSVVVVAGIVMMILPKKQNSGAGAVSMFTKEGTATIVRADGTTAATLDVEIANSPQRRQDGLMGRPVMEELQGMYFIFEYEQPLAFWMKNTILPLDMFFIDAGGTITTIHRNTTPYSEQSYPSKGPAQYVLETNAGFADKYGIVEGDKVRVER